MVRLGVAADGGVFKFVSTAAVLNLVWFEELHTRAE
jgi:hypothetical protein